MRIRSPLAAITEVLELAKESASLYRHSLRANEHVTRAVLIDPVLRSLGWDTSNPFMVEVEKQILDGRVDYALADANGSTFAIVEAKKLGTELGDQRVYMSVINYAFSAKVKDVFLTDGLIWHHYDSYDPKNARAPHVLDLSRGSTLDAAAYLVNVLDAARYWPAQEDVDDISQQVRQLASDLADVRQTLTWVSTKFPEGNLSNLEPAKLEQSHRTPPGFVHLSQIEDATRTKPSRLQLPDGTEIPVTSWNEVLRILAKTALSLNPSVPIPLKDKSGKKVDLLSRVQPAKGLSHIKLEYHGGPVFLYTNYDANGCVANALHISTYLTNQEGAVPPAVLYSSG